MSTSFLSSLEELGARYRPLVQQEMRAVIGEAPEGLYAWMRYHLGWEDRAGRPVTASPGKMLRPLALLLATELNGGRAEDAVPAAAAVELIHNFSLLHDDVEDHSDTRRGRETVWTFAGVAHAINAGDGMFTLAHLAMHRLGTAGADPARVLEASRELHQACLRLVEGQYLDISFEERTDVTLAEYLRMAGGKTAAMFAAPFAIGALLAGAASREVDAYREFGRRTGLAFQAVDDVLGIWGDPALTGKPVGDDLASRKMTYPVIVAMGGVDGARLRAAYEDRTAASADVPALRALVDAAGARAVTEAMAEAEERAALDSLRAAGVDENAMRLCSEFARILVGREF
ncbi:MAG: polyprenyl synthetase family protein [Dehalococcoidia bacterium]